MSGKTEIEPQPNVSGQSSATRATSGGGVRRGEKSGCDIGGLIHERWEIVKIKRGGMGVVFLCVDHNFDGRPVALKTFKPEYLTNQHARDRFLREGTAWVDLGHHAHIVQAYGVERFGDQGEIYIVLEWVPQPVGKRDASLRCWLEPDKPLPLQQALLFGLQIARGMKYATAKIPHLLHRDLKPENILIGNDGSARVTDFGLAGVVTESVVAEIDPASTGSLLSRDRLATNSRGFVGTPVYAAPEQFDGGHLNDRSDYYAFGCILYEMLAGRPPFKLSCNSAAELIAQYKRHHKTVQPKPLRVVNPTVTVETQSIVMRCLEKSPGMRYVTWAGIEADLTHAYSKAAGKEPPADNPVAEHGESESVKKGWSYWAIGRSYEDIHKHDVAKQYYEMMVQFGQSTKQHALECTGLVNLGLANLRLGEEGSAIDSFVRLLCLARDLGDRTLQFTALAGLGDAYRSACDPRQAKLNDDQVLPMGRQIVNQPEYTKAPSNPGHTYARMRHVWQTLSFDLPTEVQHASLQICDGRRAIACYKRLLPLARQIGNRSVETRALDNMGSVYLRLGNARRAISCYLMLLRYARLERDRGLETKALGDLGDAYSSLGDLLRARFCYERQLAHAQEFEDKAGQMHALTELGITCAKQGELRQALTHFQSHCNLAWQLGDRAGEAKAFHNMGVVYRRLDDVPSATNCCERLLRRARQTGDRDWEATALIVLGEAYISLGEVPRAVTCYKELRPLAHQIGAKGWETVASEVLTSCGSLGEAPPASSFLAFARQTGDQANNLKNIALFLMDRLTWARRSGNRAQEAESLWKLGATYQMMGFTRRAISCHEQLSGLAQQSGDQDWEAAALAGLQAAYTIMRNQRRASACSKRLQTLLPQIGDAGWDHLVPAIVSSARSLGNRRLTVFVRDKLVFGFRQFWDHTVGAIRISTHETGNGRLKKGTAVKPGLADSAKIRDHASQAAALGLLGSAYSDFCEVWRTITFYEKLLMVAAHHRDLTGQAIALNNMGLAYQTLGDVKRAACCYKQILLVAHQTDDRAAHTRAKLNLSRLEANDEHMPETSQPREAPARLVTPTGNGEHPQPRIAVTTSTIELHDHNTKIIDAAS